MKSTYVLTPIPSYRYITLQTCQHAPLASHHYCSFPFDLLQLEKIWSVYKETAPTSTPSSPSFLSHYHHCNAAHPSCPLQVTIRPGDTVVDVGANTGLFTLLAAQESGPSGRVLALEPLVATFELLQSNVRAHAEWSEARGRPVGRDRRWGGLGEARRPSSYMIVTAHVGLMWLCNRIHVFNELV